MHGPDGLFDDPRDAIVIAVTTAISSVITSTIRPAGPVTRSPGPLSWPTRKTVAAGETWAARQSRHLARTIKGKEGTHSSPLSTYSAQGDLRQDPGRAVESPAEARTCGHGSHEVRVLLSTMGSCGDVEPLAGLAMRLRALGAEVRVWAPPDEKFASG